MRYILAILLFVLLNFFSIANFARQTEPMEIGRLGDDEVSVYLKRFEALRNTLPHRAIVGYESETEGLRNRDDARRFYLTQYAVAPVIVVAGTENNLVIGNYRDPTRTCRLCKSNDFVLVADFGDGVMLFQKK